MAINKKQQLVFDVLKLLDENDACSNDIWWRTDGEYAPCTFIVNCNDVFAWASSDSEDITKDNIDILKQSFIDCEAALEHGKHYGPLLFCARSRKKRLQGAAYDHIDEKLWPLFDACGPEREIDYSNPYKPGARKKLRELNDLNKETTVASPAKKESRISFVYNFIRMLF